MNEDSESITGRTVYLVTEEIPHDGSVDHGVFSDDDKAEDFINRMAVGGAQWRKDGQGAQALGNGSSWFIEPMVIDALAED